MEHARRRSRRPSIPLGYILIAAIAIILITVIVIIVVPKSQKIGYDIILSGVKAQGLIVRDESVTLLNDYEKVEYANIVDSQKITAGQKILTAYKKGYIKATLEKMRDTQESIVAYQNQNILSEYDDKTIINYDFSIAVTIRKMAENESGYIELYNELCSLMTKRSEYVKQNYGTESNTYLQGLYSDEENMLASLEAWSSEITAANDGYAGFYCDGFEDILNTQNASTLSPQQLKGYLNKKSDSLNAFKMVNNEKWYITVYYTGDVKAFSQGSHYTVYIGGSAQSEMAMLENIVPDKHANTLVFAIEDNVEKYIDLRNAQILIGQRYEGISVPSEYVKDSCVITRVNGKKERVPVTVVYSDSKKTIIQSDSVSFGQKVYTK